MRLFEAIVDANHRALAGDAKAGLHPADYADALPVAALTCIDARLNPLIPEVLGLPEEQFIWLRNAGNIITSPTSSTMRSLALACVVKGAREIAVIGHTDCRVRATTVLELTERFKALGIERAKLPENLTEFFGLFASERQNVLRGAEFVRNSPLIGPKIPVHGLLVDIQSGRLEWIVNGYETQATVVSKFAATLAQAAPALQAFLPQTQAALGKAESIHTKIGEGLAEVQKWLTELHVVEPFEPARAPKPSPEAPQKPIPVPPPLKQTLRMQRPKK